MTQMQAATTCESCKRDIPADETNWPGESDGVLCQECWEAHAASLWWELVGRLPQAPEPSR